MRNSLTGIVSGWSLNKNLLGKFDSDQALISLNLSNVAYCGISHYLDYQFKNEAEGFIITKVIWSDDIYDTEGFIGYLPKDMAIYVVYRGTATIQ